MPTYGEMSKPFGACVLSRFSRVRLLATPWTVASQAPLHRHANTIHLLQCPSWRNQLHTAVICNPQANSPGVCVVLGVIHRGVKVLSCPGCTQPRSPGAAFRFLVLAHTANQYPFCNLLSATFFTLGMLLVGDFTV